MVTRDLRFAADEKSIKNLAPQLVGKEMSYWEENQLRRGRVTAAEVARDRYGNPFIQVEIVDEAAQPARVSDEERVLESLTGAPDS